MDAFLQSEYVPVTKEDIFREYTRLNLPFKKRIKQRFKSLQGQPSAAAKPFKITRSSRLSQPKKRKKRAKRLRDSGVLTPDPSDAQVGHGATL